MQRERRGCGEGNKKEKGERKGKLRKGRESGEGKGRKGEIKGKEGK